jgi:DNA adenine methylase
VCDDFETVLLSAVEGDFVYLDPPYVTGHRNNGFLTYNAPLFSWQDQKRLARIAKSLSVAGVYVLVTNADHPAVRRLYQGFHYYRTVRQSLIGGGDSFRGPVTEALLSSYPLLGFESEVIK